MYVFGTACGKGMKIPLRVAIPMSNSLGTVTGQKWAHSPQATQALESTRLARLSTLTLKAPALPVTCSTSESARISMFGFCPAATILGVRMHAAQSSVGKVLSNMAMRPPMVPLRSTR